MQLSNFVNADIQIDREFLEVKLAVHVVPNLCIVVILWGKNFTSTNLGINERGLCMRGHILVYFLLHVM